MAVSPSPFELIDIKLAPPLTRPGTVAKREAIARLSTPSAPFASVIAPAGYGKTTLLARWSEADPRPFAWVALDERDDDPVVFLRYVAAAIDRLEPVGSEVFDVLSGPGGSSWAQRVPRVGGALAAVQNPLVLALDDLHAVANPACLDALSELLRYVPAGSQIAVASREDPGLSLGRLRAHGQLHEVGVADLRLDASEAAELLAAAGVELDEAQLAELIERTEGWPAGLYLAALSMRAGGAGATGTGAFSGDDRFVSEYFRSELLSRLPDDEVRFLTHTSVLERMCGGLCDAVLETTGSARTLEALEHTNGFLVPLDRRGEWYRYHHLFGQLLRRELDRSEPAVGRELNRRAMAWCLANDERDAAIVYGHAAGETSTTVGLLDEVFLPLYYDGRLHTLEERLSWFGDDELVQYPALAVYGAWVRALTGQPAEAERLLALAASTTSTTPLSDGSATIEPWIAVLRAHMMGDGVEQMLADADRALADLPEGSFWIPTSQLARGVAHVLLDAQDQARETLAATVEISLAAGTIEEVYLAQASLALLAAKRGAWSESARWVQAALELVERPGLGDYATIALVHVAAARVALHEGRHDDARASLARVHRLRPLLDHAIPWHSVQVGLELARAHLALGEASAARTVLGEAERVLELRPGLGALVGEVSELHGQLDAASSSSGAWAMSLTGAELRLLPYLATHLTFPEIAKRLFLSHNTIKTEAVSIYRKLGASSRSQAIERAVEVGLLESSLFPPRANLTRDV